MTTAESPPRSSLRPGLSTVPATGAEEAEAVGAVEAAPKEEEEDKDDELVPKTSVFVHLLLKILLN